MQRKNKTKIYIYIIQIVAHQVRGDQEAGFRPHNFQIFNIFILLFKSYFVPWTDLKSIFFLKGTMSKNKTKWSLYRPILANYFHNEHLSYNYSFLNEFMLTKYFWNKHKNMPKKSQVKVKNEKKNYSHKTQKQSQLSS